MNVVEQPANRDIDRVHKYNMLRGLSHFLRRSKIEPSYTVDQLIKDLEPFSNHYKEFNLRNEALSFYENRLDSIYQNEVNLKEFRESLNSQQKDELLDEFSQIQLFTDDFYTVQKWAHETKRVLSTNETG